jgi:RNA polymerase sigma-70 factor (ECF subfamily)
MTSIVSPYVAVSALATILALCAGAIAFLGYAELAPHVSRFASAVESGDVEGMVSLLTDDALLTMPPLPLEYQGHEAIAGFLRYREQARGTPLRVVPTRANTQPAFGCYLPDAQAAIARPYGLLVLTLDEDAIAGITWFADTGLFRHFGLPRTLPDP